MGKEFIITWIALCCDRASDYPSAGNLTSNIGFAFGGIRPGTALSRYAAGTHSLDAPRQPRDGVALANRVRGDHVGLQWLAAI